MTTAQTHSRESEQRRHSNPLSLLISLIRDIGGTQQRESQHKAAFKQLLADPNYEEFRDAVIDEWVRIKYSTALQAAHPPTIAQLKQTWASKHAQHSDTVNALKAKIKGRILKLVMPNGKALEHCTGAECVEFGGWYTTIGERVGPMNLVGKVLTNAEVMQLLARL